MKRSQWILRVILVGALVSPGCGGGPTSPIGNGNGLSGGSAALNLTGTWTGTIQFYTGSCPTEPVTVVLTQADSAGVSGSPFSGQFDSPCAGPIHINGLLSGVRLYGSVTNTNDGGRLTGTASANEIKITTLQGTGGADGEGEGTQVVNSILLQR